VLDSLKYIVDFLRLEVITPETLSYTGGIIQWLLEFKEEDVGDE
jgi:hypothetical protein